MFSASPILVVCLLVLCTAVPAAPFRIGSKGAPVCDIYVSPDGTETERHAAEELANYLGKIVGKAPSVRIASCIPSDRPTIIVGQGASTKEIAPDVDWPKLGWEEVVIRAKGNRLLIAGGRPRGTLYAVYRFLFNQCGVRWYAPWAEKVPKNQDLFVKEISIREKPAFEARDPFWYAAFDADWAARNYSNSMHSRLDAKRGGKVVYDGFVHTFYVLVPPEKYFKDHPEWYSLIKGKRTADWAQLCLTNQELRDFVVEQVRDKLRKNPNANIVSVSQNDWYGPCECDKCKELDQREGSHAGSLIEFVNYIAAKIAPEFPNVAIDTLAYQYTRSAPKNIKPLPNVIVRLCSIECNFAEPLTGPSNASFAKDILEWSKLINRIYVWNYVTNFAHYVQPHPNWFHDGPNIRFFRDHGVKGLFEQGAYQSFGSEMAEMRAWVEAQLLWNPDLDDKKLIDEFLTNYYGKAARPIKQYLELLTKESKGVYTGCFTPPTAPFLRFEVLSKAEKLWDQAEQAVKGNPDLEFRVRIGRLPLRYVWLSCWQSLRRKCLEAKAVWPLPSSRRAVADEFLRQCLEKGPDGWNRIALLNEAGLTPEAFVARFKKDEPVVYELPKRPVKVGPPSDIPVADVDQCLDLQDNLASLYNEGTWADLGPDPLASDKIAAYMPSNHIEWAFQIRTDKLPQKALQNKWKVYAVVRTDQKEGASGVSFTAGVWDGANRKALCQVSVNASKTKTQYRSYLIGTTELSKDCTIWLAPTVNAGIGGVWIDRIYLVKDETS